MNKITTLTAVSMVALLLLSAMPASAIKEVSSFESHGPIAVLSANPGSIEYDATNMPMFYIDLDSVDFTPGVQGEFLNLSFEANDNETLQDDGIVYTSVAWEDDRDRWNIAWLGEKYLAVGADLTKLSKYLVDFESDEDITLKQGDVWDIGEGFTLTVQDIDINGDQVWLILEQDGSSVADIIAYAGEYGYYNDTVAGEDDVVVAMIHVDKVFAGMSANMAIIDDAEIISLDVLELDADEYFGLDFDEVTFGGEDAIELRETDGTTRISRGKTKELIKDFISIRVGDTEANEPVRFYVYNEVQVGDVVTPGTTETPTATETVDEDGTEVAPTDGTPVATGTEQPTEVETEKPVPEPGFEAVFAIAGLLAVAYLVLRKRE